jgi:hypothetical protein
LNSKAGAHPPGLVEKQTGPETGGIVSDPVGSRWLNSASSPPTVAADGRTGIKPISRDVKFFFPQAIDADWDVIMKLV